MTLASYEEAVRQLAAAAAGWQPTGIDRDEPYIESARRQLAEIGPEVSLSTEWLKLERNAVIEFVRGRIPPEIERQIEAVGLTGTCDVFTNHLSAPSDRLKLYIIGKEAAERASATELIECLSHAYVNGMHELVLVEFLSRSHSARVWLSRKDDAAVEMCKRYAFVADDWVVAPLFAACRNQEVEQSIRLHFEIVQTCFSVAGRERIGTDLVDEMLAAFPESLQMLVGASGTKLLESDWLESHAILAAIAIACLYRREASLAPATAWDMPLLQRLTSVFEAEDIKYWDISTAPSSRAWPGLAALLARDSSDGVVFAWWRQMLEAHSADWSGHMAMWGLDRDTEYLLASRGAFCLELGIEAVWQNPAAQETVGAACVAAAIRCARGWLDDVHLTVGPLGALPIFLLHLAAIVPSVPSTEISNWITHAPTNFDTQNLVARAKRQFAVWRQDLPERMNAEFSRRATVEAALSNSASETTILAPRVILTIPALLEE